MGYYVSADIVYGIRLDDGGEDALRSFEMNGVEYDGDIESIFAAYAGFIDVQPEYVSKQHDGSDNSAWEEWYQKYRVAVESVPLCVDYFGVMDYTTPILKQKPEIGVHSYDAIKEFDVSALGAPDPAFIGTATPFLDFLEEHGVTISARTPTWYLCASYG